MTKFTNPLWFQFHTFIKEKKNSMEKGTSISERDRSNLYNKLGLKGYVKKRYKKIDFSTCVCVCVRACVCIYMYWHVRRYA